MENIDQDIQKLEAEIQASMKQQAGVLADDIVPPKSHSFEPKKHETPTEKKTEPKIGIDDINISRLPRKDQLVLDVLKLRKALNKDDKTTKTQLRQMKVSQLEAELKSLAAKANESISGVGPLPSAPGAIRDNGAAGSAKLGGEALYRLNFVLAYAIEKTSMGYTEELHGDLEGWTKDLHEQKKELTEVLQVIYDQNRELLDPYIGPVTQYAMIMVGSASSRYIQNQKKVSSKKSSDSEKSD